MQFIKPSDDDHHLVACEKCGAIINYSNDDMRYRKSIDEHNFSGGNFENAVQLFIYCPNCNHKQDVMGGLMHLARKAAQ